MMGQPRFRIVVLLSGSGSNLQAILGATRNGALPAVEVVLVVSDRASAYGLERAAHASVPTLHFPARPFTQAGKTREDYDAALAEAILPHAPDLIVCAGWMRILSPAFLDRFPGKIINLHPALPGVLAGKDSLRGTFDATMRGEAIPTGCMVHRVIAEVDAGAVIDTEAVPIAPGDTLETFAARMHAAEHRSIVRAIAKIFGQLPPLT
ncbi:MAG: phosphoribosylglycinamide formyltransferase [Thermoflexales bacterium]